MGADAAVLGLGALLLVCVVIGLLYASRHRTLTRRVGSFPCVLRRGDSDGGADTWVAGWGQYCTGRLVWWRTLSLAPRPARSWSRAELVLVDRSALPEPGDDGQPLLLVRCRHGEETFHLRMSSAAYAGLVSWLESAPGAVGRVV